MAGKDEKKDQKKNKADLRGTKAAKPLPQPAAPKPAYPPGSFIATTQPAGLAKCQDPKMIRPGKDMKCVKPGTRVVLPVGKSAPAPYGVCSAGQVFDGRIGKCVKPVGVPAPAPAPSAPVGAPVPGKTDYDPNNLNVDYIPGQSSNVNNLGTVNSAETTTGAGVTKANFDYEFYRATDKTWAKATLDQLWNHWVKNHDREPSRPWRVLTSRTFIATTQPAGLAKCQDPKMIRPAKDMKCVKPGTRVTVPIGPAAPATVGKPAPAPTPAPVGAPGTCSAGKVFNGTKCIDGPAMCAGKNKVWNGVKCVDGFIATTQPAGLDKCKDPKMIRPGKGMPCVKPGTRVAKPAAPSGVPTPAPAPVAPAPVAPAPGTVPGTRTFIATTQPAGLAKCQNPKMIRPAKDMKCVKPGTLVTVPIGPSVPTPMIPMTVPGLAPGQKITDYDPNNLNIDYIPGQTSNVDNLGTNGPDSTFGTLGPMAPMAPAPVGAPAPAPAPGTWRMAAAATDAAVGYVRDTYGSQGPFLSAVVSNPQQMAGGSTTRVSVEDRTARMTYVVDMSRGYGAGMVATPWSATLVSSGLTAFVPSPGRTGSTTDYDPNNINVDYIPGQSVDVSNLGTGQPSGVFGELTPQVYAPQAPQVSYAAPQVTYPAAPQVYAPKGQLPNVMYNPNPTVIVDYIPGQSVDVDNLGTSQPDSLFGELAPSPPPAMYAAPQVIAPAPSVLPAPVVVYTPAVAPAVVAPAVVAPAVVAPAAVAPAAVAPAAVAPAVVAPAVVAPAAVAPVAVAPIDVEDVVLVPMAEKPSNAWKWLLLAALVGLAGWYWWSRRQAAVVVNNAVNNAVNNTVNNAVNTSANNAEIARLNAAIAAVNTAAAAIAPGTTGKM